MTIAELDNDLGYDVSQKTIDLVEEARSILEEEHTKEDLGAFGYRLSTTLEIFNPSLKKDLEVLNNLSSILDKNLNKVYDK